MLRCGLPGVSLEIPNAYQTPLTLHDLNSKLCFPNSGQKLNLCSTLSFSAFQLFISTFISICIYIYIIIQTSSLGVLPASVHFRDLPSFWREFICRFLGLPLYGFPNSEIFLCPLPASLAVSNCILHFFGQIRLWIWDWVLSAPWCAEWGLSLATLTCTNPVWFLYSKTWIPSSLCLLFILLSSAFKQLFWNILFGVYYHY